MWNNHEGMGWWWVFGSVWMVVIWAAVISLVVWATKKMSAGRGDRSTPIQTPWEIAQTRLATGEISEEQFEELKRVLTL